MNARGELSHGRFRTLSMPTRGTWPFALPPADVLRRFGLWAGVCSISAAPSFIWAANQYDPWAMATGVACFVILLTVATCTERFERFKRRPFVRRTLYIGYGTRIGVSLLFPLGMFLDMFPGLISTAVAEQLGFNDNLFIFTLVATLVQGTILNVLLSIYMLIVYSLCRTWGTWVPITTTCKTCGYDLRGSTHSSVCPECGSHTSEPAA